MLGKWKARLAALELGLLARMGRRAVALVWQTNRRLTVVLLAMVLLRGVMPALIAWAGKQIVDEVINVYFRDQGSASTVLFWVGVEVALVATQRGLDRLGGVLDSVLRTELGQRVNEMILEKALDLELADFENSEIYDKMNRARRGASYRPLALVFDVFHLIETTISLLAYGVLLWALTPWALLLVAAAALPLFVAEMRFSKQAFNLFSWRAPATRKQSYYESVIAHGANAKEVKLFGLGRLFLDRYRSLFQQHRDEDRRLAVRHEGWTYLLDLVSTFAFYGAYAWVAVRTARGELSFGDMTMYLMVFRGSQFGVNAALRGLRSIYEHTLYVRQLFDFVDYQPAVVANGTAEVGPDRTDGFRFEDVEFAYPGSERPVLSGVNLHIPPGHKLALVGENGAGKTTLIKLMTGLYRPTGGRILLDGLELGAWSADALRRRVGVIFQDFVRYQLLVGENIGVGDVRAIDDEERWKEAARAGRAEEVIATLPSGFHTQLGKWFEDGEELSGGQWQKIALSRAFMRRDADILVLDEPTASMDALAEMQVFDRFRALTEHRMAILISHRFSTVRMADTIAVLHEGRVVEHGTHEDLLREGGRYARLFNLQASGYR